MMLTSWRTAPRRPPTPRRMRRHGRRWPWLVALVPLLAAGSWWLNRDRNPDAVVALSPPTTVPTAVGFGAPQGERTTEARCWMVAVDESSSMADADSTGTRADAVKAAANFLAAYGIAGDRIGATWFADTSEVLPPAAPAAAKTSATGTVYLGSGTQISSALDSTLTAMQTGCGTASGVLVLVSDGAASDGADFDTTEALLTANPDVDVHLIAMNGGGAYESSRSFWENPALGLDSVQTIDSFGSDEVAAAVASILSAETGQQVTAT